MSKPKPELTTLEAQWRIYRDACYKEPLPAIQESETRQAFYAGILLALKIAVESTAHMDDEAAFNNIKNMIDQAQAVCRDRIYEMKARN